MKNQLTKEEERLIEKKMAAERERIEKLILSKRMTDDEKKLVDDVISCLSKDEIANRSWSFSEGVNGPNFYTNVPYSLGLDSDSVECKFSFKLIFSIYTKNDYLNSYFSTTIAKLPKSDGVKARAIHVVARFSNNENNFVPEASYVISGLKEVELLFEGFQKFRTAYDNKVRLGNLERRRLKVINDAIKDAVFELLKTKKK
jgi:hypothetical protein